MRTSIGMSTGLLLLALLNVYLLEKLTTEARLHNSNGGVSNHGNKQRHHHVDKEMAVTAKASVTAATHVGPIDPEEEHTASLEITRDLKLTLVYGEQARRNFTEAEKYCVELGKKQKLRKDQTVSSHLMSFNDAAILLRVTDWVLKKATHRFWTGSTIMKIVYKGRVHFTIKHQDGSPDRYRFIYRLPEALRRLRPDHEACLAVDFDNGEQMVHDCSEIMNFLCMTRINDPEAIRVQHEAEIKRKPLP